MQKNCTKLRKLAALKVERLEPRRLRAGVVAPLAQAVAVELAAQPYDPAADLAFAHDTLGLTGAGQTVAIIDSGIAYDHYALGGGLGTSYRVVGGWDFTEQDADPYDDGPLGYHGTHLAGIVGSSDEEVPGVAPGADLVALRVFDDSGHGDFDWIESSLSWVHEHRDSFENPITTVNLSIGSGVNGETIPDWTHLEDELAILADDGIFVAVAAGNGFREYGVAGLNYPAASPFVVPVSSVDASGQLSDFSQRHERVLAAPGELINSTVPDYLYGFDGVTDDFARVSGTSMAAPYVAGASVLVREAFASLGQEEVTGAAIYEHLIDTSDTILDAETGAEYRRLNLRAALSAIVATPTDPLSSTSVTSLGTIEATTLTSAAGESFEFTAAATSVLLIDGSTADDLTPISVFDAHESTSDGEARVGQRIDGEVSSRGFVRNLRFVAVRRGHRYRMQVPAAVEQVVVSPLVSLNAGDLVVPGHAEGDVYVVVGPAFAVAARGVREQVSTGGRLQDNWTGPIDVEQTSRGLVVRIPTNGFVGYSPNPESTDATSGRSKNMIVSNSIPSWPQPLVFPSIPIDVGFHEHEPFSPTDYSELSAQLSDATFADSVSIPEPDQLTLPLRPLDQVHSENRHGDGSESHDSELVPRAIADAEDLVVDQILSEQRVRLS